TYSGDTQYESAVGDREYFTVLQNPNPVITLPTISGYKYTDHDGADHFSAIGGDDTPLQNWTVNLYDSTGTNLLQTTQTDSNGFYQFVVDPGSTALTTYRVVEAHPTGWTQTFGGNNSNTFYTVQVQEGVFFAPNDPGNQDPIYSADNNYANFQN